MEHEPCKVVRVVFVQPGQTEAQARMVAGVTDADAVVVRVVDARKPLNQGRKIPSRER